MKICSLGSGSEGNCTYVESDHTRILIDAGFSAKEVETRLSQIGVDVQTVDGLVLTHEHADHIRGVGVLARRYDIPVFSNAGTFAGGRNQLGDLPVKKTVETGTEFDLGSLRVRTFSVPHDTHDPVGVVVRHGLETFAIVTDLGYVTSQVRDAVRGANVLLLEANHDLNMLVSGPYPWELKQRIKGRFGHLSNDDSFHFLEEFLHCDAATVVLGHLSQTNNHPELVRCRADQIFSSRPSVQYEIARQDLPGKIHTL
jgi:phosphoribosyl 1,2-cyclic phosphodiesterase